MNFDYKSKLNATFKSDLYTSIKLNNILCSSVYLKFIVSRTSSVF